MKSRRLGCLTGAGLLAVALTLLVVSGVFVLRGGRMFSPGPLHAEASGREVGGVVSHADTGGDCTACHTAPWDRTTMAQRCLDCHSHIAADLADATTLHGALHAQGADMDCRQCHTEHRGPAASLTFAGMDTFPHDVVGFSLAGHSLRADGSPFDCEDCHTESLARFDAQTCDACHRVDDPVFMQAHAADFETDCLACHDGIDSYGRDTFDHSRVFPLTGRHVEATCAGCHANARTAADLQATPTDCVACHAEDDAHDGQFGQDCAACHTTSDWRDATFDHSLTAFPLTGQHAAVECTACHIDQVFRGTPTTCVACHAEDDAHDGQLGQDCAACHNTSDWRDVTFDHSLTAFPLTGRHEAAQCAECHVDRVFAGTPADCVACHVEDDAHDGQLGQDCAACHTTSDWRDVTFDHSLTAFPLTGRHEAVECAECHVDRVFAGTPTDCVACHVDPAFHAGAFGVTCTDCHTTAAWQPARFDRPHTFPFDHGDAGVNPCRTCHVVQVQSYTCYECHEPAEIAEEHLKEGIADFEDCSRCHPTGQKDEAERADRDED